MTINRSEKGKISVGATWSHSSLKNMVLNR